MAPTNTWAQNLSGILDTNLDLVGQTPQNQPLDERQVANNAGGFVYQVDDFCRLRRFLILGSEGGSYYQGEVQLTLQNAKGVKALLDAGQGLRVVQEIVSISTAGRAAKQGPAIFALALCCRLGDKEVKAAGFAAMPKVCRTGSTLFDFVGFLAAINGEVAAAEGRQTKGASWGRSTRTAIAAWYLQQRPLALAYQVTKYVQRGGWSHRDLLRLAHPAPASLLKKRARPEGGDAGATPPAAAPPATAVTEEEDWTMVDDVDDAASTHGKDEEAMLEKQVADLQLLFKYITEEERWPPAPEEDSQLAAYLRDAHTLKKGTTKEIGSAAVPDATAATSALSVSEASTDGEPKQKRAKRPAAPVAHISEETACQLIRARRFSREHVGDTCLLTRPAIWQALLDVGMPFTALTRNLGKLTSLGLFGEDDQQGGREGEILQAVVQRFTSQDSIKASRVHPITLLQAQQVYEQGHGDRGSLKWEPCAAITSALDQAFYLAFRNVEPTGKRFLAGVDVSSSMDLSRCLGMDTLTARDAATAMLMCLLRTEEEVMPMAFSTRFQALNVTKADSLYAAINKCRRLSFGGTDCAQPMLHAIKKNLKVDVFVVYTDSETWAGGVHPAKALQMYRQHSGIDAKLVVMAFSATRFSIADPKDRGMLDIAGLDSGVPEILRQFVTGAI